MTAKEYLNQAHHIDRCINSGLEQIASLRGLAVKATQTFSDMPGSPNRNIHKTEDIILKIVDMEDDLKRSMERLVDLKAEIMSVIAKVEDAEYRTLLELRYLCFKTWEQIAVEMGYELRWVYRLHQKALDAASEHIPKTSH